MIRSKKTQTIILRLEPGQKAALAMLAEQNGSTMSEVIRLMINKKTKSLKTA